VALEAAEQRTVVAHSDSYGFGVRNSPKPRQGRQKTGTCHAPVFRPIRGWEIFCGHIPTVGTVGYYRTLLRSFHCGQAGRGCIGRVGCGASGNPVDFCTAMRCGWSLRRTQPPSIGNF